MTRCVCDLTPTNLQCITTCSREMTPTQGEAAAALSMRHPPGAKLPHHGRFTRHRELFRPLTILPREISPQTIFEVTLSPCRLEILLSLCSVTAVQTSFQVQQFKRNATSSRNYSTGIVLFEACRQIVGQSDVQLFIGQRP